MAVLSKTHTPVKQGGWNTKWAKFCNQDIMIEPIERLREVDQNLNSFDDLKQFCVVNADPSFQVKISIIIFIEDIHVTISDLQKGPENKKSYSTKIRCTQLEIWQKKLSDKSILTSTIDNENKRENATFLSHPDFIFKQQITLPTLK